MDGTEHITPTEPSNLQPSTFNLQPSANLRPSANLQPSAFYFEPVSTPLDQALKRSLDVAAAVAGLVVLSPVFMVVGLAIKIQDGGPVFYRAGRVGRYGSLFGLFKFRTMVVDAAGMGPGITTKGDKRITSVGRWLRRTKLDELPQLINVLTGDMSLVGPRPEDPRYVSLYTPEQWRLLDVRPGITSAASLTYRHEEDMLSGADWEDVYRDKILPAKLAIDMHYMAHRTLRTDLGLIGRTVTAMFK